MICTKVSFKSATLKLHTQVNVLIPNCEPPKNGFPVLYLLHGLSDNQDCWTRFSSIERYAEAYNIAVIMPDVNRSFYADMKRGNNYWTFISEELVSKMKQIFKLSDRREDTYAAGLSMGGYGAFKLALNFPDRFCAAGSFSGALGVELAGEFKEHEAFEDEFECIFGSVEEAAKNNCNLVDIVKNIKQPHEYPRLFQTCGTEDYLYSDNLVFKIAAKNSGLDLTYHEWEGSHTWDFWDKSAEMFLKFIAEGAPFVSHLK